MNHQHQAYNNQAVRNIVIAGGRGAIASAFIDYYLNQDSTNVHVLSRASAPAGRTHEKNLHYYQVDYMHEPTLARAVSGILAEGAPERVIVTSGLLHSEDIQPEKSLRDISSQNLQTLYFVNAVIPGLIAKHLIRHLHRQKRTVFAALSARVSSMSDNFLGGWYGYRASKAALNMLLKTASIEAARTHKQAVVVGLHPGTVDSTLSKPFQRNIPDRQLFSPAFSVEKLVAVMEQLHPEDSGKLFAWDGSEIPY